MKKPSVLLIGYDEHLCLSILYCLRKAPINIHLLTHNQKSVCRFSRYLDKVFYYTNYDQIPEAIAHVADETKIDLVMPYDELESLYVSNNSEEISRIAPIVPLTDPELFEKAINKYELGKFLAEQGLSVMPKSINLNNESKASDLLDLNFPILIKPSRSSFGRGITSIKNQEELDSFFANGDKSLEGHAAQEFVVGSDITCNIYAIDGEIQHHTIQESPVKQLGNYAKNDDLIFHEDESVLELVASVAKALKWNGVACIDLRRDASTGKVYLLEINGRFWGSVSSSYDKANVNFPLIMINQALLGLPLDYQKKESIQISLSRLIKEVKSLDFSNLTKTKYQSYFYDPIARFLKYMPR